jgi:hypothetical protein
VTKLVGVREGRANFETVEGGNVSREEVVVSSERWQTYSGEVEFRRGREEA